MSSDQYAVIESIITSKKGSFLATIMAVEGSAYRREGTMMFISESGIEVGLLSGGCLEEDIMARIAVLEKDKAFLMNYDLRSEDDLGWGQGIGCDGSICVLVEPITSDLIHDFIQIKNQLRLGNAMEHKKCINKELEIVESCTYNNADYYFEKREMKIQINELASNLFWWSNEDELIFQQTFFPPPRLIIYGAGPDVLPVVSYATNAGFYVVLADWREAYCTEEKIPFAKEYIIDYPIEAMKKIQPTTKDYCLLMTHSFSKDQELVNYLFPLKLNYLGILGSKKRTEKLLNKLNPPEWVYYPVGLPIASESPEEIAISIVAELILIKNTKKRVAL